MELATFTVFWCTRWCSNQLSHPLGILHLLTSIHRSTISDFFSLGVSLISAPQRQRGNCWGNIVSRHLRKRRANSILELETKDNARDLKTVCGQKHNSGVAAPNSSFLFHHQVFIPFCPTSKAQIFTSLTWPIDLLCQKVTSLNYSDGKTFPPEARAHFLRPSLISAEFFFFVKTILASTPNSFYILELLQWLFWNFAVFYMSVDLCWREPHKDLLTPHGRISQNVLGRDNFLIIPPNFTYEGIFQPLCLQWWEQSESETRPGMHTFLLFLPA